MDDYYEILDGIRQQIEALQAELEQLRTENADLKRKLAAATGTPPVAEDRPLTVYPSVEAINWAAEQWPDEKATWSRPEFSQIAMQRQMFGPKFIQPPYRNVIVEGYGEVRRVGSGWNAEKLRGGFSMPDWYAIALHRIYNLLAPVWAALVQAGDGSVEEDAPDQDALIRAYAERTKAGKAGLRYAASTWEGHSRGKELLAIYKAAGGNPKGATNVNPINVAPNP